MTKTAAVSGIVIALMVGYYWARWRRAEQTRQVAKAAAESAGRAVWRARGVIVVTGLVVYAVISFWFRGRVR
ncbi:MAG: hypothetical protein ACYCVZ_05910 [Streptosporangiaceae bacterium]